MNPFNPKSPVPAIIEGVTQSQLYELLTHTPAEQSAPYLLGATLKTPLGSCRLVEVEAYSGTRDPGSHAYRGVTPRTQVMFGPAGHIYTYFTYGNHWMVNLTAHPDGEAGAILIRAAIPLDNLETLYANRPKAKTDRDLLSGPGKICAAYRLNQTHYGLNALDPESPLQILAPEKTVPYVQSTRIGLAVGKGDDYPWRFVDAENIGWASKPNGHLKRLDLQTPPDGLPGQDLRSSGG